MPFISRLYIRTALVYLATGTLLGGIILWNKAQPLPGNPWTWLAAHVSLVTWGWLWHLTLGVAYWILPRFGLTRPHVALAAGAYAVLNLGLLLAALAAWLPLPWASAVAGVLQLAAALAFAIHAWPRIRKSAYGR